METKKLEDLYNKMTKVHAKANQIFDAGSFPATLKNEYKNKVSQYDSMYESVETMKALSTKPEAKENLVEQQIEILNTRIKWELDWMNRTIKSIVD